MTEQYVSFDINDPCIQALKNPKQAGVSSTILFNVLSEKKAPDIDFILCDLNAQSLKSVFSSLKKTPWVKRLDLSINALTDEALTVIKENLFDTSIESLSLEQNQFTSQGLSDFCESLSTDDRMSQIKSLSLKKNQISSHAWVYILSVLKSHSLHLDMSLMLSINDKNMDNQSLKNALSNSEYLSIEVSYNFLQDASLQAIFEPVHKTMLRSLDISFNKASKDFLSKIPEMVKYSTLVDIKFYNQVMRLEDIALLKNTLENNKQCTTLAFLGGCFTKGRYLETNIPNAPDEIVNSCITFLAPRNKLEEKFIWMGYRNKGPEQSNIKLK